jgi:hypothetical protein
MRFLLAFLLCGLCSGAFAQTSPGFTTGQVPTAAQWNSYFAGKADTSSGTLTNPTIISAIFSGGLTVDTLTVTGGGALAGTFTGAPTLSGNLTFSGTPVFSAGAAMSGTFTGAHTYSGALTLSAASTALTVTNNVSLGGTLTTGTGGTNGFSMQNSLLSVTGTGNPILTIRGLGTGQISFQTGATPFTGFSIVDGGASAVNGIRIVPGTTGSGASIQALGDAAAILNFKAGTGGTAGSAHFFIPISVTAAMSQTATFNLAGINPAQLSTIPLVQNITMTGNNGALTNTNGMNQWLLTDQAAVNGSLGVATFSQNVTTGSDGERNMVDMTLVKNAASLSGDHIYEGLRLFVNMAADERGTGTAITASQAGTVLTVTAATSSVLAANTIISGPGMVTERILTLGTGTGGTGTYNVGVSQTIGPQSMVAGNYKGSAQLMNPDITCNGGLWWKGCQQSEWDIRDYEDSQYKTGITINYATHDSGHGLMDDCAFCVGAGDFAPGVGKGRVMFQVGTSDHSWPIDVSNTNSAVVRAQHNIFRTYGTNPSLYAATYGIDFTILECGTACWRSPGFTVDGAGQLFAGPLTVAYASTGATISANRVSTASAVPVAGGSGYTLHDEVLEPLTGSLWEVSGVGALNTVTALTLTTPGFATSCPGAATPFTSLGNGAGLTATITCSTSNGIVLAGASEKIGFYGTAAIVKATPVGACAGSTGCQALRDALGSLGLINTGSITN